MTSTAHLGEAGAQSGQSSAGIQRDGLVALAGLGLLSGLYLDGWAHLHVPALETFFTPWHAVLYGSFALLAAAIAAPALRGRLRGGTWRRAVPAGYGLALLGIALFGGGGLLDLGWHSLFGIESNTEALLSPPHLLLATGAALMVTAPLRSAWPRDDAPERWATWLPPLLSLGLLLALTAFFTSYAHPFAQPVAAARGRPGVQSAAAIEQAVTAILLQCSILSGTVLLLVRRWGWRWPAGSLTLLLPLGLAPVSLMFQRASSIEPQFLIGAAVLAGLGADGLLRLLRPSAEWAGAARIFAALFPAMLCAVYFATIALRSRLLWTPHLTFGAITLSAIAGVLVSYLVFPPPHRT